MYYEFQRHHQSSKQCTSSVFGSSISWIKATVWNYALSRRLLYIIIFQFDIHDIKTKTWWDLYTKVTMRSRNSNLRISCCYETNHHLFLRVWTFETHFCTFYIILIIKLISMSILLILQQQASSSIGSITPVLSLGYKNSLFFYFIPVNEESKGSRNKRN